MIHDLGPGEMGHFSQGGGGRMFANETSSAQQNQSAKDPGNSFAGHRRHGGNPSPSDTDQVGARSQAESIMTLEKGSAQWTATTL